MTEITFRFVIELSEETMQFITEMVEELRYIHQEENNDDEDED